MPTPAEISRNRLLDRLKVVPRAVLEGKVDIARRYKDWAAQAAKLAANRKAPVEAVNRMISEYDREFV